MRTVFVAMLMTSFCLATEPVIHRDVRYTEPKSERQTLDVYVPAKGDDHPIVIWVHGRGWGKNDRADMKIKPEALVDEGFIAVTINEVDQFEATIKQMARQIAAAVRWTRDHAKDFGGDPGTIFVGGHYIGAQSAALVCTDDTYLKAEGLSLSIIKGCVPVDGDCYDVPLRIATAPARVAESLAKKYGSAHDQKEFSPVTHVAKGKDIPPFLILRFTKDPLAEAQEKRLQMTLEEVGIGVRAVTADGESRGALISELGAPLAGLNAYHLFGFLEGVIKPHFLETFQAKLAKNLTPAMVEATFGTPNAISGSGVPIFRYDLADGTSVFLNFNGQRGRLLFSGMIFRAWHVKKDGTEEEVPLK